MRKHGIPVTIRIDESCLAIATKLAKKQGTTMRGYLRGTLETALRGNAIFVHNVTPQQAAELSAEFERIFGGAGRITDADSPSHPQ